jgi:hypothetical protein
MRKRNEYQLLEPFLNSNDFMWKMNLATDEISLFLFDTLTKLESVFDPTRKHIQLSDIARLRILSMSRKILNGFVLITHWSRVMIDLLSFQPIRNHSLENYIIKSRSDAPCYILKTFAKTNILFSRY